MGEIQMTKKFRSKAEIFESEVDKENEVDKLLEGDSDD